MYYHHWHKSDLGMMAIDTSSYKVVSSGICQAEFSCEKC